MFTMPQSLFQSCVNIIYPQFCVGCHAWLGQTHSNRLLCDGCFASVVHHVPPFCTSCGRNKTNDTHNCPHCNNRRYCFQNARSICVYDGIAKQLIHDFKYRQKMHIRSVFRELIENFCHSYHPWETIDAIVPIPLHPTKLREREYNQSEIIAHILATIIQRPLITTALQRIRNTKPQIALGPLGRQRNIAGCFRINAHVGVKEKNILLVDDVLTTGSTACEAARVLNTLNPKSISVFTLAS